MGEFDLIARYFQRPARRRKRLFQLGDEDLGPADQARAADHIGLVDPPRRPRRDDDGILPGFGLQKDRSRTGIAVAIFGDCGLNA